MSVAMRSILRQIYITESLVPFDLQKIPLGPLKTLSYRASSFVSLRLVGQRVKITTGCGQSGAELHATEKTGEEVVLARDGLEGTEHLTKLQHICSRLPLANRQVFLINTSPKDPDIELHFTAKGLRGNKGLILQVLQVLFFPDIQERGRDLEF